jgi:hypothetical protein
MQDLIGDVQTTEFYNVNSPDDSFLTQDQVSGNGITKTLGNSLEMGQTAEALTNGATAAILLGANFFSNSKELQRDLPGKRAAPRIAARIHRLECLRDFYKLQGLRSGKSECGHRRHKRLALYGLHENTDESDVVEMTYDLARFFRDTRCLCGGVLWWRSVFSAPRCGVIQRCSACLKV